MKNENIEDLISLILITCICVSVIIYQKSTAEKISLFSANLLVPTYTQNLLSNSNKDLEKNIEKEKLNTDNIIISENSTTPLPVFSNGYQVPADIVELQNEYEEKYGEAEHDGKVIEKQYGQTSATSVYKNIMVRNTTPTHSINIEKSLNKEPTLDIKDKSKPTVLIFHTHTTESYQMINNDWYTNKYPTRHDEKNQNMVRVGDAICDELEKSGIGVIHDTVIHDHKYTGAYDHSRDTIEKILKENPTIQIVLDVHRDAIQRDDGTKYKPTATINGKKAAQVMIIAGCEDGKITDFPNWDQNLTFALQLHDEAETMYSGIMRPILFSARKYNMDVVPCSALLEFGSDSNTLAEAEYSGHLIGKALSKYICDNEGK